MMVPVSLAVASRVPSLFSDTQERGERWASMTLTDLHAMVSKMSTSPDVGAT